MSFRNSTLLIVGILLAAVFVSCSGLATKEHPPLVYALNLSSSPATLSLVKDEVPLVEFVGVDSLESRPLTKIKVSDGAILRVSVGDQAATEWTDPSGTPYSLRFQAGQIYAIVIDQLGRAAVYYIPETYSNDPKLSIVNAVGQTLSQVQAAPDWAKNVKVYVQDLVPVVPSEFYSVEAKTLGLYWQTLDQVAEGRHTVAKDADGKPLRQIFESGHYYLFLAGEGSIRDLTPNLD